MSPEPPAERARAVAALNELRAEIASLPRIDTRRRERVLAEISEIEALLRETVPGTQRRWNKEGLERLALEFELSHPEAAALVNRVTNLLASMGI